MIIEKNVKVWLNGAASITDPISVSQYDTGWRFIFTIYRDNLILYFPEESSSIVLEGRKPDGTVFAVPGRFENGTAIVDCESQITSATGEVICELRISEAQETIGTANFKIIVEEAPLKGYIASQDDFSAMQQILDKATEASASASIYAANAATSAATAEVQAGMAYRIAPSAASMIDHDIGYVYTGDEAGYTNGGWYYWNGSQWVLGGMSVDITLSVSGAAADAAKTGAVKNNLIAYGCAELLSLNKPFAGGQSSTRAGVTYAWDSAYTSCHVTGTRTDTTLYDIFNAITAGSLALMDGIVVGATYRISYDAAYTLSTPVMLAVGFFDSNAEVISQSYLYSGDSFTVPSNAVGMYLRVRVTASTEVNCTLSNFRLSCTLSNKELETKSDELSTAVDALAHGTPVGTWSENHWYITTSGATVDINAPTQTSASVDVRYLVTPCSGGDVFKITATGGASNRAWCFIDASGNSMAVSAAEAVLTGEIVTAPMGSAYLVVNDKSLEGSVRTGDHPETRTFSLESKYATTIAAGTDLDSLTTPGNYYVLTSGVAATLLHSPVSNIGFALKVLETIAPTRRCQIIITSATTPGIWVRSAPGGVWADWVRIGREDETITTTNIHLTASNYQTYFPNGSFNDAPVNSIVSIGDNVPLTDGPDGDSWIGYGSHTSTGYIAGTLLTFRAHQVNASAYRGLTQLLIGYRAAGYSPTLSYRIAILSNDGYTWSNWSKFEQDGYLRSGNRVISANRMDETVHDLDDMPPNEIWQIDKNCTGATVDATLGHHPFPGASCVAVNMAFSYSTRHGQVQTVYCIDGRVAWRYGFQENADEYRWSTWRYYATYIPQAPSTDGTYTLRCTVAGGTASYSWVSTT